MQRLMHIYAADTEMQLALSAMVGQRANWFSGKYWVSVQYSLRLAYFLQLEKIL